MADAPAPERPGFGARLTAKAGPLPVWAWAVILLVGGYLAYRFATRGSTSTPATPTDTGAPAALDANTTPVGGDTGSPPSSGMGGAADNYNADLYGQLTGLQGSVDALTSAVQLSPAFWPGGDEGSAGSGAVVPNGTTPAGPAVTTAAKTPVAKKPAAKAKPAVKKPAPKPAGKPAGRVNRTVAVPVKKKK